MMGSEFRLQDRSPDQLETMIKGSSALTLLSALEDRQSLLIN